MDHKKEPNPSAISPEEQLDLQLENLLSEEMEPVVEQEAILPEETFQELLIGEPIVSEDPAAAESNTKVLDDAELEAILQAAFRDIPDEADDQSASDLPEDTTPDSIS